MEIYYGMNYRCCANGALSQRLFTAGIQLPYLSSNIKYHSTVSG